MHENNFFRNRAQVVGWPPIRSFRKNTMASNLTKNNDDDEGKSGFGCLYVKVSMDGAPYLRKVDLKTYNNYMELSSALEKMFSCFTMVLPLPFFKIHMYLLFSQVSSTRPFKGLWFFSLVSWGMQGSTGDSSRIFQRLLDP